MKQAILLIESHSTKLFLVARPGKGVSVTVVTDHEQKVAFFGVSQNDWSILCQDSNLFLELCASSDYAALDQFSKTLIMDSCTWSFIRDFVENNVNVQMWTRSSHGMYFRYELSFTLNQFYVFVKTVNDCLKFLNK